MYRLVSVINTYAWISATADSSVVRMMGDRIVMKLDAVVIEIIEFPSSVIRRCPAIRLAVNRTHNVRGRMRFLDSSIITMNGMRGEGVPCGSM